ncbi:MAG TPA: YetF domain-containing protein [Pyrinomonadaceae bacterium]|jgi:uncharacterized membrane protein YcaP (DUF421 family)|nr:YetF domain-containing protein [Pyrinomonadaceae bacterium]
MEKIWQIDWEKLFVPQESLAELFVRGTLMYVALFIFLRFFRRQIGGLGITDLLVIVLLADVSQNAFSGDYKTISEGVFLILTVGLWDWTLDFLGYRFPAFERILRPQPLPLVKNGKMLRRNMQREMITQEELLSQLRQQGILDLSEAKECRLEGDGNISVIKNETQSDDPPDKKTIQEKVSGG